MQAFTDVPVKCCDCEETFLSASSLLQHFANHVKINFIRKNHDRLKFLNNNDVTNKRLIDNKLVSNFNDRHMVGNELISNNISSVLVSNCDSSSLQSDSVSDKSESTSLAESLENQVTNGGNIQQEDIVDENAQHFTSGEKLLPSQKTKNKDLNLLINNNDKKQFCVEFNSEKMLINIERLSGISSMKPSHFEVINNNNNNNNEICVDTLGRTERIDLNDEVHSLKRKLSNRKQSMPKKIERLSNGLVKIAPRPKDMPVIIESEKRMKTKKRYNCHLCTKTFGWSTDLKRHILVHTGERPFKCNKCNSCFTRNFLLQKHKNKVHPNNKELLEKNKLLEAKVNENLIALKSKLNRINETICNNDDDDSSLDVNDDLETTRDDLKQDEEMVFMETKIDIKEEDVDPLSFPDDPDHLYNEEQNYIKGDWIVTNNNNNVTKQMIKSEDIKHSLVIS